jgi:hypothetical protein
MTQADFDYWVEILEQQFPQSPSLRRLGTTFVPRLPEEAAALRDAHARAHPVYEMRDQDGAKRVDPSVKEVYEWVEIMKATDALVLRRRDGGSLEFVLEAATYSVRCRDSAGKVLADAEGLNDEAVRRLSARYLCGDVPECVRQLRDTTARPRT